MVQAHVMLDFILFTNLHPDGRLGFLHLNPRLVDGGNQAETRCQRSLLRRALVDLLDALIPSSDFALLFPIRHFLLHMTEIGDHVHELRIGQLALEKCVGDVVPELENVAGWHRPQFERLVGGDFPARIDPHHVVVVQLAFDHVATVTLLDLADEIRLFVIQLAT